MNFQDIKTILIGLHRGKINTYMRLEVNPGEKIQTKKVPGVPSVNAIFYQRFTSIICFSVGL